MTPVRSGRGARSDESVHLDLRSLRSVRPRDYALRFAFGAAVSAMAALAARIGGEHIGGLFLAFPAILPATLTLLQKENGKSQAVSDAHGATLGAVGMVAFAVCVALLLGHVAGWALVAGLGVWMGVSLMLYGLTMVLVPPSRGRRGGGPDIDT